MASRTRGLPRPSSSDTGVRSAIPALALALLGLCGAAACGDEGLRRVPAELRGTWRGEQPPYQKRYLEVHADRLILGVASEGQDLELETLEVLAVHPDEGPEGERVFRIGFRAPQGYEDRMVLRYRAAPEPALRLDRRDAVWRRTTP